MSGRLRLRLVSMLALVAALGFLSAANFVPESARMSSPLLPDDGLVLGLDLRGGIHWVLGVKLEVAEQHELGVMRDRLEEYLNEEKHSAEHLRVEEGRLRVELPDSKAASLVREWVGDNGVLQLVEEDGLLLQYALTDEWRQAIRSRGMDQVLEVLRRRIADPAKGIQDSVITRQGEDRVLVQIPGGEISRDRARELLRVTGFLEFKIVRDSAPSEQLLLDAYDGELPEGTEIAFERNRETQRVLTAYLVGQTPDITGKYLTDARVGFDQQQRPNVQFTFDLEGGKIFSELSGANIKKQLAIILDEMVYSAPVINSRIGSRGQIDGRFSMQEAADLAVVLRAGSLAVPVEIEEERTVGPALGLDSIRRGVRAAVLGLLLTVLFAIAYYRLSGGYASLALAVNLVLLMGIMSLFHATLTLPGLAGVVLTVGMAIDANVIIFERIREELRASKAPRAAVATGFSKARWTILDANITTLITAVVLYSFGTGPIKGFAVTLSIGVMTSVFAALVVTRLMFDFYPGSRHLERLSI